MVTRHCNCKAGWIAQMCDQRRWRDQRPRMGEFMYVGWQLDLVSLHYELVV